MKKNSFSTPVLSPYIFLLLANIQVLNLFLPVPVIHEDEPRKTNATRRATWDGSRDSSTVAQLLSSSKGLHGYGSSGWFCKSLPSLHNNMVIRCYGCNKSAFFYLSLKTSMMTAGPGKK